MSNPFLTLGGIAVGVLTVTLGAATLPGWAATAQHTAAIHDLDALAEAQSVAISLTGSAATSIEALGDGDFGVGFSPTLGICSVISAAGSEYVVAAKDSTGWHARINGGRIAEGATISEAVSDAGGLPSAVALPDAAECDPAEDTPQPVPHWYALHAGSSAASCLAVSELSRIEAVDCELRAGRPVAEQYWQLIPVDGDTVTIRPVTQSQGRLDATLTVRSPAGQPLDQQWRVQRDGADVRLVSAASARCLVVPPAPGTATVGDCDKPATLLTLERVPLTIDTRSPDPVLNIGAVAMVGPLWIEVLNDDDDEWVRHRVEYLTYPLVTFDRSILHAGENRLRLTFPGAAPSVAYEFTLRVDGGMLTAGAGFS